LIPGDSSQVGIRRTTTERDLVRLFGAANVRRADVDEDEMGPAPGTIVFPDDATRRLEIFWGNKRSNEEPVMVRVQGKGNRWTLAPGIRIGTTLDELERMNGRPFTLSSFCCEYGGSVASWNGGRLDKLRLAHVAAGFDVRIYFELGSVKPRADLDAVRPQGDNAGISSGLPALRRLRPYVRQIQLERPR
jgi:hypothetical protein